MPCVIITGMKNIYVFGDSLVYGQGDLIPGGWVTRLQKKLGESFNFKNFGIPGDTSEDLLNKLEYNLKNTKPDLIIISIGANDSQYKKDKNKTLTSAEQFKKNLNSILKITKKYSNNIIFIGVPCMDDTITTCWHYLYFFCNENILKFNKIIKNFCVSNNIKYVDIYNSIKPEDLSDGAHPNPNGYQKISEKIEQAIDFKAIL